jgi:hypothetical protein
VPAIRSSKWLWHRLNAETVNGSISAPIQKLDRSEFLNRHIAVSDPSPEAISANHKRPEVMGFAAIKTSKESRPERSPVVRHRSSYRYHQFAVDSIRLAFLYPAASRVLKGVAKK